jgi:hypothetical protein
MVIKYLREKKADEKGRGKPVGVVVAISKDQIGYSLCNPLDQWDKQKAKRVAIIRAKENNLQERLGKLLASSDGNLTTKQEMLFDVMHCVEDIVKKYDFSR